MSYHFTKKKIFHSCCFVLRREKIVFTVTQLKKKIENRPMEKAKKL